MERCDGWQLVEAVQTETRERTGCTLPQGSRARQYRFTAAVNYHNYCLPKKSSLLRRQCDTSVAQDDEADSSINEGPHRFRERLGVGNHRSPRIEVGMRCLPNPRRRLYMAVQSIPDSSSRDSSKDTSDLSELRQFLPLRRIEVVFG